MPGAGSYTKAMLGLALARAGQGAEARKIQAELEVLARTEYVSPMAFATIHLGLREPGPAMDWIERARDERRGWLCYIRVHPIADPVRGEPRFKALMQAMRLAS